MTAVGSPIEAILTLNANGFHSGLADAQTSVKNFVAQVKASESQVKAFGTAIGIIGEQLLNASSDINRFNKEAKGMDQFNRFTNGVKALAQAIQILGSDASTSAVGVQRVINIIREMEGAFSGGTIKVQGLASALRELRMQEEGTGTSTQKMDSELKQAKQDLMNLGNAVQPMARVREQADMMKAEFQRARQELMNFARYGVQSFNEMDASSDRLKAQMETMNAEFERSKAELLEFARYGRSQFEQVSVGAEKLATAEEKVVGATNQATQSIQRQSSASRKATASTEAQTQATNRLGKAMSSLRMIGTMVASMMVWNFAQSLVTATRETVNAKSEMEGYFKMLHFSDKQIGQFNKALDRTVGQFKRINKYALGETISSIGVEFNLTTKEMEKAMPVVSMITSEYLRAGRNVNEASLAVKDILQGEFQRLSRETGVKGKQLEEAGWSGDKNDVMGLLEALEKVGKSRNWDIFVTKANSLNDAVLILQNRFSEWTAEMVNVVQPSILNVFNTLMMFGGAFSNVMGGLWKWLNGDGIANQVVKWIGLATAISSVVVALVHYRTGANLVQLAQMGLRGSITATIFGLKAEEVATYGSRNAIVSKLTSLKAEQVATLGVRRAILTKVLGLKAETVATMGLKNALGEEVIARRIQEAQLKGATVQQKMAIYSEYEEQMAKRGTLRAIIAKVAGVEMETFVEKGLIVALAQRIATSPLYVGSLEAEEVAELSTAQAGMLLMSTLLPLVAVVVGLAVAIYSVVKPLQDASEEMKKFNNLVKDGDNIIKSHKSTYDSVVKSYNSANEELQGMQKNTKAYLRLEDKVNALENDKDTAYKNWKNSIKAVEMARSSQAKYDEEKSKIAIHNQTLLADAYIKAGLSSQEASELASHELAEAEKGAKQLRDALGAIRYEANRGAKRNTYMIDYLDKMGLSDAKLKQFGQNMSEAQYKIREGMDKFMTSDDWMERITGWFEIQQGRLEEWWTELNGFFEVRDWDGVRQKLLDGIQYIFSFTPIGHILEEFRKKIEEKGFVNTLMEELFGEGNSDGIVDIIGDFLESQIAEPIGKWLIWFLEDPSAHLEEMQGKMSLALAKFLFGRGSDGKTMKEIVDNWIDTELIPAIAESIQSHLTIGNISGALSGAMGFGAGGVLVQSLPNILFGEDASYESIIQGIDQWLTGVCTWISTYDFSSEIDTTGWVLNVVNNVFVKPLANGLLNGILQIPIVGDFVSLLGLLSDENVGSSEKGRQIGGAIGRGLTYALAEIPIVGDILRLLGVIPSTEPTAKGKGQGVGKSIDEGVLNGMSNLGSNVVQEFQDALSGIGQLGQKAYDTAKNWASELWEGVNSILDRHSPGMFSKQIGLEFGSDIPNAIDESSSTAYLSAQSYAQNMYNGMNSVSNTGFGLGGVVDDYETDAQTIALSSKMMGNDTTSAFNQMQMSVNATTNQMQTNVVGTYSQIQSKQASSLNTMKTQNISAYNDMYLKSNQSMIQMRDSTTNVTHQMTNAWNLMKNNIVASAHKIQTDSEVRFNSLSTTIGGFYRKIQNPSQWGGGAGYGTPTRVARKPSVGKALVRGVKTRGGYAGGLNTKPNNATMSVSQLKRQLCPTGDCGNLFDGYNMNDTVNVWDFLQSIGEGHGLGGWNFGQSHYNYIKSKSDAWDTAPPVIDLVGGISTNKGFKVSEFNDGTPKVSFSTFEQIATSIFSTIPYRFYFDSSWKGSWLGALQSGACNCYDGALALIALANTFGFSGSMAHGTWTDPSGKKTAHVWAVINGVKMDTTGMQQRGSWRPSASAGGNPNPSANSKTVNITVDMSGATVYGVEDLDNRIQESVAKGLQAEFNDPYTVSI